MKKPFLYSIALYIIGLCLSCSHTVVSSDASLSASESYINSLVFIDVSTSSYDDVQPWKLSPSVSSFCYGTAVGPYHVLTTAEPLANASMIQIKVHGKNEFIPASIKIIDYDLNLCLLEIDAENLVQPLQPISFSEQFSKNLECTGAWLSSDGSLKTARGFTDRAIVLPCPTSYQRRLCFVISNASRQTLRGEVYMLNNQPIGLAYSSSEKDVLLIPGETINRFLKQSNSIGYIGFGTAGFETYDLLDPSVRKFLKMPEDIQDGVFVSSVYSYGTGSGILEIGDVVTTIDGHTINANGQYTHPVYDDISYEMLIQKHAIGEQIQFTVWRDGKKLELNAESERFQSSDMLVPYQEYDLQPEYMVNGGYVFQKLTRDYLKIWGDNCFAGD